MIEEFTTDYLENEFAKLRLIFGSAYFITLKMKNFILNKTKLLLQLKVDIKNITFIPNMIA